MERAEGVPGEAPSLRGDIPPDKVEESCRKSGISRVTAEELEKIRARMPTPKIFG